MADRDGNGYSADSEHEENEPFDKHIMRSTEETLSKACERLQQWRNNFQRSPKAALLALLLELSGLAVDDDMLRRTGVGREVNQQWIRRHDDERIRNVGRKVIHAWKERSVGYQMLQSLRRRTHGESGESTAAPFNGELPNDAPQQPQPQLRQQQPQLRDTPSKDTSNEQSVKEKSSGAPGASNNALCEMFKELSRFESQQNKMCLAMCYNTVAGILADHKEVIMDVSQVEGVTGIGQMSQAKIREYLETGTLELLERYRRGDFGHDDTNAGAVKRQQIFEDRCRSRQRKKTKINAGNPQRQRKRDRK